MHRDLIDHGPDRSVDDTAHDDVLRTALREMSETGRRHRTRRWYLAAALTALVGVVVTATNAATPPMAAEPEPIGLATTPLPGRPALADVWPDAVHVLPTHLADGRQWVPQVMVDRRALVATDDPDYPRTLLLIDLRLGQVRKLADLPHPPGSTLVRFAVGSGHLVWLNDDTRDQIWRVSLKGGRPHLVATLPLNRSGAPADLINPWLADRLVIDDNMVYVSTVHTTVRSGRPGGSSRTRNLLRVPLDGGTPQPVPGSEGRQILVWPWLGKLPSDDCDPGPMGGCLGDPPYATDPLRPPTPDSVLYADLRNLTTGERHITSVPMPRSVRFMACGVSYCLTGGLDGIRASNPDGSDWRDLRGFFSDWTGPLTLDRFIFLHERSERVMLHDLKTGRKVPVGLNDLDAVESSLENTRTQFFVDSPEDRMVLWRSGNAYVIVDLGAIR